MGCETRVNYPLNYPYKGLPKSTTISTSRGTWEFFALLCFVLISHVASQKGHKVCWRLASDVTGSELGPWAHPMAGHFLLWINYYTIETFFERGQSFCIFDPDLATESWIFVPPCSWKFRAGSFGQQLPWTQGGEVKKPTWKLSESWPISSMLLCPKSYGFGRGAKHWVKIAEALVFEVDGSHGPVGFTNVHRENHIVQLENVDLGFHSPSPHVFVAILLAERQVWWMWPNTGGTAFHWN